PALLANCTAGAGQRRRSHAEPDGVLELVFGNEEVFGAVAFFVWFDSAGERSIIVVDESEVADEGRTTRSVTRPRSRRSSSARRATASGPGSRPRWSRRRK